MLRCFLEPAVFTSSQTQQSHRAKWFREFRNEFLELLERKTTRSIRPFGCTTHSDQSHRIALCRHITAPHSELPKLMQNAPNMNSAFGRQLERMQPQFNGTRFYVSERALSAAREYVIRQLLIVAVACAEPLRHSFCPIDVNQAADREPSRVLRCLASARLPPTLLLCSPIPASCRVFVIVACRPPIAGIATCHVPCRIEHFLCSAVLSSFDPPGSREHGRHAQHSIQV